MIDKTGKVQAHTFPGEVDEQAVQDLIDGKAPKVESAFEFSEMLKSALGPDEEPRPATTLGPRGVRAPGVRIYRNRHVSDLFSRIFQENTSRIMVDCDLPNERFDFIFSTTGNPDHLYRVMRDSILTTFGLEASSPRTETSPKLADRVNQKRG